MKVSELTGVALDWAVTKTEGFDSEVEGPEWGLWGWATDWGQGGPIIEREGISLMFENGDWIATALVPTCPVDSISMTAYCRRIRYFDYCPLVAAMRCYVASNFGEEIEVPDELMKGEKV